MTKVTVSTLCDALRRVLELVRGSRCRVQGGEMSLRLVMTVHF